MPERTIEQIADAATADVMASAAWLPPHAEAIEWDEALLRQIIGAALSEHGGNMMRYESDRFLAFIKFCQDTNRVPTNSAYVLFQRRQREEAANA